MDLEQHKQVVQLAVTVTSTIIGSNGSVTFQVGANANDTIAVAGMSKGFMLSMIASQAGITTQDATTGFKAINGVGISFSVSNQSQSQLTLGNVDKLIQVIDSKRAELGAVQNRMESTIRNQANIQENESDARSRIRDTDFAEETASFAPANQILHAGLTDYSISSQSETTDCSVSAWRLINY